MTVIQFPKNQIDGNNIEALKTCATLILEGYEHLFINGWNITFENEEIEELKCIEGKGGWGYKIVTCNGDIEIFINNTNPKETKYLIDFIESFKIMEA